MTKIKYIDLVVKRKELIVKRNEIKKDLDSIKYVIEEFHGKEIYKGLINSERKKNLKQFNKKP